MDAAQRLRDLAGKIESRLASIRARLTAVEARPISSGTNIAVGPSPPASPAINDLWVDTSA